MGGRGSGGRRTGSGRKQTSDLERAISGAPGPRGVVLAHPSSASSTAIAPVETFEPPASLTAPLQLAALAAQLTAAEPDQIADLQARLAELEALALEAVAVWQELAPHAFEARTLTPATTAAFVMLCRGIARERALSVTDPGGPNHRGLMQRVGTWLKDFGLAPLGKAMYAAQPEAAVNPLDRFTKKVRA